ncbi:MAG TPA: class I SAM-dependent methyltransferase [Verrucomicrobiae bacterium]|nr:class I SAM-dependent methyltransferase [Verrucomicrobiae bacterium]
MLSEKHQIVHAPFREEILSPLPPLIRSALVSMYNGEPQIGLDGERHNLHVGTGISTDEGMWLFNLCCEVKPKATLEVGLACGFSTLYFLAAIHENGFGHHTAIDPFQSHFYGIGLRHSENVGMSDRFRFLEKKSALALSQLARGEETFPLIFIDGRHHFEYALSDFMLASELCPAGGYIIFDDFGWSSVNRVVAFVRSNRKDFEELKIPVASLAAFRRIGDDERPYGHFVEFFEPFGSWSEMRSTIRPLVPSLVRRGVKAIARLVKPYQSKPRPPS